MHKLMLLNSFQEFGVVLVNTDEAGTLIVTNFRLLFVVSFFLLYLCQHYMLRNWLQLSLFLCPEDLSWCSNLFVLVSL